MVYFISEAKIKEMCNDNIESELIRTSLTNVQTIELKTIIGDSLYNTIEKIIINDLVVEPYTTLLTSYIHPYLQYAVLAELVIPSTYKIGSIGLNQAYTDSVNTTTKSDAQYVRKYYTDKAAFMEQRLTEYLEQNRNIFVDYDNYKDITKSRSTTSQSGLFLGGARNGNRSTDTHPTFIHDNTIRAYIRYDEPQALTTDQQAQVKRNIGIENINFDDIYTKDDIDRNYYTKQQTDTLIANIDIPTKTSELELDNVYSKTQVDNLIENVDVDLSNYYTKEQTDTAIQNAIDNIDIPETDLSNYYTKEQTFTRQEIVDMINEINYSDINNTPTLSNVATSGNYNDLNNLPTLFDGDYNSLKNKPTLFSGSYTDLSDKPQVYTTEQVYNKTEIDTQITDLNNQIGNINNLLETI